MTPAELRAALGDLNALMQSDLLALWRAVDGQDVEFLREALQAELPGVVDPYLAAAGDVTADWYQDLSPTSTYVATPAPLPPQDQLETTARWAAGTVLTATEVSPLDLLAGAMQRALFGASRRTVVDNAEAEPGAKWARYASANACEFCRMLATRGAVYASEESATRVTGVSYGGTDYRKAAKLGVSVRDLKTGTRASRAGLKQGLGSRYHDNCRCIAVAVRPGKSYEPPSYVEQWEADYRRARAEAGSGKTKDILSAWRKLQP